MRFRRGMLAFISLLLAGGSARAQVPPAAQVPPVAGDPPLQQQPQQTPPPKPKKKKKKKKKPATPPPTQPSKPADEDDDEEDDKPPPDYHGGGDKPPPDYHGGGDKPPPDYHGAASPPKLNTDLKETDPSTASRPDNPWAASGIAKKKGGDDSSSSSSSGPSRPNSPYPARGVIAVEGFGGYASSNLRIGFGVRGGYTLANNLYLGGAFTYHLGTRFGSTTVTFFYLAPELGYEYRATKLVTLRPYAGIGLGVGHTSDSSNLLVPASTNASFTFYPGVQLDFQLPHAPVYIGVDLRLVLAAGSGSPDPSFGFFVLAGGRF